MEKSKGDLTDIFRGAAAASLAEDSFELLMNDFAGEFPGFFFGSPEKMEGSSSLLSSVLHQSSPKTRSKESAAAALPKLSSSVSIPSPRLPPIKRRKNQARKVLCIPAPTAAGSRPAGGEVVPSDLWAWRKYGQKPIKGSPYPRGYYRCSSSKGCSARKQVERSRTDPNMLVITYTSDHNHPWPTQRNSLAGSTRISHHSSACSSSAVARETKESAAKESELQKLLFPDDLFADLHELDDAPISLFMDEEENNSQVLGAFNMLGWETKRL